MLEMGILSWHGVTSRWVDGDVDISMNGVRIKWNEAMYGNEGQCPHNSER